MITPEALATLPPDIPEALSARPGKPVDELSKAAHDASFEAGKDHRKIPAAMLAHAKACAAHKADAEDHRTQARELREKGKGPDAAAYEEAAYESDRRGDHHAEEVLAHVKKLTGAHLCYSLSVQDWDDVAAAAHSLGRAKGDQDAIKAKIIAIAKEHGWESGLPDAWKEPAKNAVVALAGNIEMDDLLGSITDDVGSGLSKWIPVVYPGKWNGMDFTAAMIREMAESFIPKAESCPVKIGHNGPDTQPQISQIREVKIGDCTLTNGTVVKDCLFVRMDRTPEALASQRQYRMRSIEAWPPDNPSNPTKGRWNLKGLGLLGAAAPAVPNLPPTQLSANNPTEPTMPETDNLKTLKDQVEALSAQLAKISPETMRLAQEKEELEAKLSAERKGKKEAEIRQEIHAMSDKLVPAQKEMAIAVALALPSDELTVTLSGKETPISARTAFMALLQGFQTHGLTNALNVPSLAGKKGKDTGKDTGDEDEDDLDDAEFSRKKTREFREKHPDMSTDKAIEYAQKCLKERKAKKESAKK